jgi:hypothetical protein
MKKTQQKARLPSVEHPLKLYSVEEIISLEYQLLEKQIDYSTVQKLVQIYTVALDDSVLRGLLRLDRRPDHWLLYGKDQPAAG